MAAAGGDSADYTWVAATIGSNNAAGYQLATGEPVMPIGGFNGSDPSPTLAQFQQYVADGKIHYFIGGGGFRANGGSSAVPGDRRLGRGDFTAQTVDGVTLYDLSAGTEALTTALGRPVGPPSRPDPPPPCWTW